VGAASGKRQRMGGWRPRPGIKEREWPSLSSRHWAPIVRIGHVDLDLKWAIVLVVLVWKSSLPNNPRARDRDRKKISGLGDCLDKPYLSCRLNGLN